MFRRDPGLRVVPGKGITFGGPGQPFESDENLPPVPERSILLLQQEQPTGSVLASCHPCRVQMHQRQQGERGRGLADRVRRQQCGESDGFIAQFPANGLLGVGRQVALGEEEVTGSC